MRTTVAAVFACLCLANSNPVLAQTSEPQTPKLEVGVQATSLTRFAPFSAGGRFTVNLTDRAALDLTIDRHIRSGSIVYWGPISIDLYHVDLAWTFRQIGDTALFASLGGGVRRRQFGPFAVSNDEMMVAGFGAQRRLLPHLALRAETQLVIANGDFSVRFAGGASLPIGRYQQGQKLARPASAALPGGYSYGVKPGQRVWVTTKDGNVCSGKVRSISQGSIDLLCAEGERRIAIADIGTIEAKDSVRDGMVRGILAGAGAGAVMGLAADIGPTDEDSGALRAINIFGYAGIGAGIGAFAGVVIDDAHEGRRVVYRRSTPTATQKLVPLIVRRGAGVGGAIPW